MESWLESGQNFNSLVVASRADDACFDLYGSIEKSVVHFELGTSN